MTTSNTLIISALALCSLQADVIELTHGDLLSGTIEAMSSESVTIASELSPKPLEIESANIHNIIFDHVEAPSQQHVELITLENGDTLPCDVITLDGDDLTIATSYAGRFSIPRQHLHSLQFGVSEEKVIYLGTDAPTEWTTRKGQWNQSKKGYACQGLGTLARELELPENLRIQFTLYWKNMPNFSFRFCAENNQSTSKQNAYEFIFNSAGIQLNRGVSNQTTTTLTSIDLNPHDILNHELNVDIRVNRKVGKITLLLDGIERASEVDPIDSVNGNFIILNNRSNQGVGCHMGNLSISEWEDGSRQKRQSKLIQENKDILIDTEDEQYQGHITSISKAKPNKRTVLFEIEHAKAPLKVPDRRISALIFAKLNHDKPSSELHYTAQLVGGGSIQLGNPQLAEGKVSFTHPILGTSAIDTTMINRITTHKNSSQSKSESK